jgi:hypothetical protein
VIYINSHALAEHVAARRDTASSGQRASVVTADVDGEEPVARRGNPDNHGGRVEKSGAVAKIRAAT